LAQIKKIPNKYHGREELPLRYHERAAKNVTAKKGNPNTTGLKIKCICEILKAKKTPMVEAIHEELNRYIHGRRIAKKVKQKTRAVKL
jgi:hypothetical protein